MPAKEMLRNGRIRTSDRSITCRRIPFRLPGPADPASLSVVRTLGSAALAKEAAGLFPSGVTHDSRYLEPYGVYIDRAEGPHKWDVDGNRYVDFFGGHGALILGHRHAAVMQAVGEAFDAGTHF